jgi:G3E family GTPase
MDLDNIVAVVDAARMFDEFQGGHDLVDGEFDEDDIESLLIQQLEFCTTVILNKADLVSAEQLAELRAVVRSLQKDAKIIEAVKGEVPLEELLNTGRFDFDDAYGSAAWIDAMEHPEEHDDPEVLEYDITTFVYERRKPFSLEALQNYAASWPREVIRCKGVLWFDEEPDMCYIFEQAGRQMTLTPNGRFVATAPEETKRQIMAENPEVADRWDPVYGDRMDKLVFIGRHMDADALVEGLDSCLVDDFEL